MDLYFELDSNMEKLHFHDKLEILFVLSGRVAVMVCGKNFVLNTEDFSVFNPFENHELYCEKGTHILSAYISFETLRVCELGRIYCISSIMPEQNDYLMMLRTKLAILYKYNTGSGQQRKLYIMSQLYGLLAVLKQHFQANDDAGENIYKDNIQSVFLYVNSHYMEDISLKSTAEKLFISKSHLSREFLKQTGMHFSDYLRNLRVRHAAYLLETTDDSVTEIAMKSGFSSVDTLIINFKKAYGLSPKAYKNQNIKTEKKLQQATLQNDVSYVHLLKFAAKEENLQPLNKQETIPSIRKINLWKEEVTVSPDYADAIGIGFLNSVFKKNRYQAIVDASRELGVKYVFFHGILNDCMDVYHENQNGTISFSYLYIDMAFDLILSAGLLPWIEIGYTPSKLVKEVKNMYHKSHVVLPHDLGKWDILVRNVLMHLTERYGEKETSRWRFSVTSVLFSSYGLFTLEEYLAYYRCTWNAVRCVLPEGAVYGPTFDIGLLKADGMGMLRTFLSYCRCEQCMPDAISFQIYSGNYAVRKRDEIEAAILVKRWEEPVPPNENPDFLKNDIRMVRQVMEQEGFEGTDVVIDTWNATIWMRDLGNDTCFAAACIIKNMLDSMGCVKNIVHAELIDVSEDDVPGFFIGDGGLVTKQNLPKAAYFAFAFLHRLEDVIVERGDGYVITCSENRDRIAIILYNYCYYNMKVHLNHSLPVEEQLTVDRYYGFLDSGIKSFQLHISGIQGGIYQSENVTINREHGSSYDRWLRIGSPRKLSAEMLDYLKKTSLPEYQYGQVKVEESGTLLISEILDAHEVKMIRIYCGK